MEWKDGKEWKRFSVGKTGVKAVEKERNQCLIGSTRKNIIMKEINGRKATEKTTFS